MYDRGVPCPNCGNELTLHFLDHKDRHSGEYIAERFELCSKCEYKRGLSRVTESGQVLFASTAPKSIVDNFEPLFTVGPKPGAASMTQEIHLAIESARDICLIAER